VSGFPTLKVFKDEGKTVLDYEGPRDADGIVEYVKGAQGPVLTEVRTEAEVRGHAAAAERVALFFGKEPRDASRAFAAFKAAAAKVKPDFVVLGSFEAAVGAALGIEAPAIVVLASYKQEKAAGEKGERMEAMKEGMTDESKIREFLYNYGKPLVALASEGPDSKILSKTTLPILHMIVPGKDANRRNMYRNRMTKVATKYAGRLAFAVSEADRDGKHLLEEYGLSAAKLPTLVVRGAGEEGAKYRLDKNDEETLKFKAAAIAGFADDFLAGRLVKYIKSEALPPAPTEDEPVQVVVGSNFNDIVMDKSKHVLLEMYAPWCGHCKSLEPEYKKAAKKLRKLAAKSPEKYGNIVLAKMDATANDSPHPALQARGYPTIKFIAAGTNKIVDYGGDRKADGIVDWLKKEVAKH